MVLQGITVLDLTSLLPGPLCTQLLADFGARVIKVEGPDGDLGRVVGSRVRAETGPFLMLNRNKKSIVLNLKHEKGKEIFFRLAEQADVIIETFRPGAVRNLGIDYDRVKKVNPGIIYCSLSGYGQDGPFRDKPNHDINFLALTGLLDITGLSGSQPIIPGGQIGDISGALLSVIGILLALMARDKTGKGQYVDVAMMDAVIMGLGVPLGEYLGKRTRPERGKELLNGGHACYNVYETEDNQYMSLGAVEPHFWQLFCQTIGKEELIARQYGDADTQAAMIREVAEVFKKKTQAEWTDLLKDKRFPCEPVLSMDTLFEHPQVRARNMVAELDHPTEGRIPQLGIPIKLSETPGKISTRPPLLGEHSEEILSMLGYTAGQIEQIRSEGVIGKKDRSETV